MIAARPGGRGAASGGHAGQVLKQLRGRRHGKLRGPVVAAPTVGAPAAGSGACVRLWEREEVSDAIRACADGARTGTGGAVFVLGDAGLGKTAVLNEARVNAGDMDVAFG